MSSFGWNGLSTSVSFLVVGSPAQSSIGGSGDVILIFCTVLAQISIVACESGSES